MGISAGQAPSVIAVPERSVVRHQRASMAIAAFCLLILIGGYLRLSGLEEKSISHPEIYVPGIHLPEGISQPRQRLTLTSVLTGTFTSDTHPPGFYLLMWFWTKCFGAGILSIRLPAALLGVACIPLLLWLGLLTSQKKAAWMAAGLLAINAHHVFWSRTARMYSLACFLGLLATIILVLLATQTKRRMALQAAYVAVLLAGVASHVFFWLVLGTHILWVILSEWWEGRRLPDLQGLQVLATILCSPFLAFAAYQSGTTVAPLSSDIGIYAREFLQFGFLFPQLGFSTGLFLPSAPFPGVVDGHIPPWRIAFVLFSVALLFAGVMSLKQSDDPEATEQASSGVAVAWPKLWLISAALATVTIVGFVVTAQIALRPPYATLKITKAMCVLPFVIAGCGILLKNGRGRLSRVRPSTTNLGTNALLVMMAVVPFAVLLVASKLKPVLNARGMTVIVPYLLLVLSAGIVYITKLGKWIGATAIALLVVIHALALLAYVPLTTDPVDYKGVVADVSAQYQQRDLVFFRPGLWSTPFLYYLNTDRYRVIGTNYAAAASQHQDGRVWVILREHQSLSPEMTLALQGRQLLRSFTVAHAHTDLYGVENSAAHR